MRKILTASLLAAVVLVYSSSVDAAAVNYEAVPSTWFIQDYIGSPAGVWLWRAPLPNNDCYASNVSATKLSFPSTVTDQEVNRFWSMVMTAKSTGATVGVWYDNSTCLISSFYWPNLGG